MDNLTHSLVGALIGQIGLKRKTALAMPTLIIAANIPDIDAVAVLLGGHQHLAIRRGITHGPIAMLVLPLLLWGAMLWFDRWQTRRGSRPEKRPPVNAKWLLALAYIGCLSHPLFDWFNSYGIRLLEPFSSQWFYGDTLFIIDLWLWASLGFGLWYSMIRERLGSNSWRRAAQTAGAFAIFYVGGNFVITQYAEDYARRSVDDRSAYIVANPVPFVFWQREMLWQAEREIGSATFSLLGPTWNDEVRTPREPVDERVGVATATDPDADAFIFWSRMELVSVESNNGIDTAVLTDQRFSNPMVADRFTVRVRLPKEGR